ncbi:MAG: rhodanese-like domain-containing protein [candidate division Zixibacteria bacterium]|nr:rhodanese-like domain-containing protein [candidate division Zixibacteria bacterium]
MKRIIEIGVGKLAVQSIVIIVIAVVVGLVVNAASPNRISLVGTWKVAFDSTGIVKPDYYEEGDTLVTIDQAIAMYQSKRTVYIDARYPEEYDESHIKGALLLPFDEYDDYIESILEVVPPDAAIICYCTEEECDLSLYLARVLRDEEGFEEVYHLYGGYDIWLEVGMPTESSYVDDEDGGEKEGN